MDDNTSEHWVYTPNETRVAVKGKIVGVLESYDAFSDEAVIRLSDIATVVLSKSAFISRRPSLWVLHSTYEGACDVDMA